jgi:hypothetical protein
MTTPENSNAKSSEDGYVEGDDLLEEVAGGYRPWLRE